MPLASRNTGKPYSFRIASGKATIGAACKDGGDATVGKGELATAAC
jgi:hypothetical protein